MANPRVVDSGVEPDLLSAPRKRYSDEDAHTLMRAKARRVGQSLDPTQARLERLWFRCVAALAGFQHVPLDTLLASLDSAVPLPVRSRGYTANHIFPMVQRQVARLTQSKGTFSVLPSTPDYRDVKAAKFAEHMLDYWHTHLKLAEVYRDMAVWLAVCGTTWQYVNWDPKAGKSRRIYANPFDSQPLNEKNIQPHQKEWLDKMGAYTDVNEGDLVVEALSPFQVFMPQEFHKPEHSPWVMIEHLRSIDWLWDRYPKKAKEVRPNRAQDARQSPHWRRLASLVHDQGIPMPGISITEGESVLVREFWRPPSGLLKEGARIVFCQETLLENEPHISVSHGVDIRFPVFRSRFAISPGRGTGMGMVEHLLDPQDEYSTARSQVIQHRNRVAQPQWTVPLGAKLRSLRNEVGDVWEYTPGFRPELVQPPALSQTHVQTQNDALSDMRAIASQNEASQGINPSGVRSGLAVQALTERDMETISPSFDELEEARSGAATAMLRFTEKFMSAPRAIELYGESRANDIVFMVGPQLRGNTHAQVKPGSTQPRSKVGAQNKVMELVSMGALNPADPDHRRYTFRALDLGELDQEFTLQDKHRRVARQENLAFLEPRVDPVTGMVQPFPDVQDIDDHVVHTEEHVSAMLDDQFGMLPPERQMAMRAHLAKHNRELVRAIETQMMAAAQSEGGGAGGPGGGSPPAEKGKASQPKKSSGQSVSV